MEVCRGQSLLLRYSLSVNEWQETVHTWSIASRSDICDDFFCWFTMEVYCYIMVVFT